MTERVVPAGRNTLSGRVLAIGVLVALLVSVSLAGCTSGNKPSSVSRMGAGRGSATLGRTTVVLAGSTQEVKVATSGLPARARDELTSLTTLGIPLALGVPTRVTVNGPMPAAGATLTRTYPAALPKDATAAFAYFDDALGTWKAVPSTLSADRRSLTATVHHLSWWTDLVGTAGSAIASAASWAFNQVGKIADVRVSPPHCVRSNPRWVPESKAVHIATDPSNPLLFCTGHDAKHPDLLVLKARVNRGYGYTAHLAAKDSWSYNSTEGHAGEISQLVKTVTGLDSTVANPVASVFGHGTFVGAGDEVSYGLSQGQASSPPSGKPILTLRPANGYGFTASLVSRLLGGDTLDQAQGVVAAAVALAGCARDLSQVRSVSGGVRTANTCLTDLDVKAATQLGVILQHFTDPATQAPFTTADAGRLAGRIVGMASIATAIAYPLMVDIEDRNVPASARTITLHPSAPQPPATQRILIDILDTTGHLKPGYTGYDPSNGQPVDCSFDSPSPVAVSAGTHSCGSTADNTFACWTSAALQGLSCLPNPWTTRVMRRSVAGTVTSQPAPKSPRPFGIELDDGTRWWYRIGGAWSPGPDNALPIYGCQSGSGCNTTAGTFEALLAPQDTPTGSSGLVEKGDSWYAWRGQTAAPPDNAQLPPATLEHIAKMWFITTGSAQS